MLVWRAYQLLLAFAGGSLVIYFGIHTKGPPINPIFVGLLGFGFAWVGSVGLAKMIDGYRYWRRFGSWR